MSTYILPHLHILDLLGSWMDWNLGHVFGCYTWSLIGIRERDGEKGGGGRARVYICGD
jgi:hypothetical protein